MFCNYCGFKFTTTSKFCSDCGKPQPSTSSDSNVEIISSSTSLPSFPSIQVPSTRLPSSGASIINEVRNAKAKATIQDRANSKDVLSQSNWGVDPRGKHQERRIAELFIIEQGGASCRLPNGYRQLRLSPSQPISDWSDWVKEEARQFRAWQDRGNPQCIVEDVRRKAWVALVVGNSSLVELVLEQEQATLRHFLTEISDKDGKSKIGLMFPIWNLDKEAEDNSSFLSIPYPKQQKSLIGDVVKKGRNKKEVKEKVKAEVKDEVEVDNEVEFPNIDDIQVDEEKRLIIQLRSKKRKGDKK